MILGTYLKCQVLLPGNLEICSEYGVNLYVIFFKFLRSLDLKIKPCGRQGVVMELLIRNGDNITVSRDEPANVGYRPIHKNAIHGRSLSPA